jgi:hypothetical protein
VIDLNTFGYSGIGWDRIEIPAFNFGMVSLGRHSGYPPLFTLRWPLVQHWVDGEKHNKSGFNQGIT